MWIARRRFAEWHALVGVTKEQLVEWFVEKGGSFELNEPPLDPPLVLKASKPDSAFEVLQMKPTILGMQTALKKQPRSKIPLEFLHFLSFLWVCFNTIFRDKNFMVQRSRTGAHRTFGKIAWETVDLIVVALLEGKVHYKAKVQAHTQCWMVQHMQV